MTEYSVPDPDFIKSLITVEDINKYCKVDHILGMSKCQMSKTFIGGAIRRELHHCNC